MSREKKNPMLTGLFNILIPGSSYLYVENDRSRFIQTLVGGIVLIFVAIKLGTAIQDIRNFPLPQGICTGILLLLIIVPLFLTGQKTAHQHNQRLDSTAQYNLHRTKSRSRDESGDTGEYQKMREEGLISEQELQTKKDASTSKQ